MNFKLDEIAPPLHPLFQGGGVVGLDDLVAASKLGIDPACDVREPIRSKPPKLAKPFVDRLCVAVAKALDHHVGVAAHCDAQVGALLNAPTPFAFTLPN